MIERPPASVSPCTRFRENHCRRELLFTLIGICRNLERMQATVEAREACRQVGGQLQSWLDGRTPEKAAGRRR